MGLINISRTRDPECMEEPANLWDEVERLLQSHNRTDGDVSWVECRDYSDGKKGLRRRIPFGVFKEAAKATFYDKAEYLVQIPGSLRIYGRDRLFVIGVADYDGRQSLVYIDMDVEPPEASGSLDSLHLADGDHDNPEWKDRVDG